MYSTKYISFISIFFLGRLSNGQSVTQVLYAVAPACIQSCLYWSTGALAAYLIDDLGCAAAQSTVYNQCYCTQIQYAKASSILSGCISRLCTGTTLLPNAISLYDNYCTGAGYPREAVDTQTSASSSAKNQAPQSSNPTPGNGVSTSSSPGNTSPPASSSSICQSNPGNQGTGSNSKSNIGLIVGGIVGGLGGAALLLGGTRFYLRSQRKNVGQGQNHGHNPEAGAGVPPPVQQPEKEVTPAVSPEKLAVDERPVSPVSPILSPVEPVAAVKKPVGGRAELMQKENEPVVSVTPAPAPNVTELQGEGRYGLRPDELDANGRYIGELHGDGRQFTGSELP